MLLVLSGPSGSGKTTLARRLVENHPEARFSISVTTREPRGEEKDGVDYQFVDTLAFQQKIDRGELVEWAEVHGHFYGSPRAGVEEALQDGGIVVFDIDVQGGRSIQRRYPEAVLVFVLPPPPPSWSGGCATAGPRPRTRCAARMLAARAEMEQGAQHLRLPAGQRRGGAGLRRARGGGDRRALQAGAGRPLRAGDLPRERARTPLTAGANSPIQRAPRR